MANENPRTGGARDHDKKGVIEGMIPGGEAVPSSGGAALAREVGSARSQPTGHEILINIDLRRPTADAAAWPPTTSPPATSRC